MGYDIKPSPIDPHDLKYQAMQFIWRFTQNLNSTVEPTGTEIPDVIAFRITNTYMQTFRYPASKGFSLPWLLTLTKSFAWLVCREVANQPGDRQAT